MKKLIVLVSLLSVFMISSVAHAQVIVSVRPIPSKVVIVKPVKARRGHIWVSGHWKWHNRRNSYIWIEGRWMKNRAHHRYVAGHWVTVGRRGHKWVPGYWARV